MKSVTSSVSSSITGSVQGEATSAQPQISSGLVEKELLERVLLRLANCKMRRDHRGEPTAEMDVHVTPEEIYKLCQLAVESFIKQPALLQIGSSSLPLTICADIHGQFRDVRMLVDRHGFVDKHSYLFLGDYADRGTQGVETISFLFAAKVLHPERVFLLRGNHEDYNTSMVYGLLDECLEKFGNYCGQRLWLCFVNAFNHMPFAALVDKKILCMHGGLSPEIHNVEDINKIRRPSMIPLYGMACDIVWSDPLNQHDGWSLSPRGISFTFDDSVVEKFCEANGIDLIVRGHQITNEMHRNGYQFSPGGRVLTLFTASDYLRTSNTGATLTVTPNLEAHFTLFRPVDRKRLKRMNRHKADSSHSSTSKSLPSESM
ncbi:unnamed protein product [Bursaphelenchus xylophilus]|uniref:Serine/threonine-protein phosphatase n=1 Tax=Bursaphelenchus xylophilus TaxID=6326 RepID=A0A1I7RYW5_BURXY|nr:unnamed protein product [Bursaphelenchus xylophilus]CAG9092131.1 unnamed protein product [Bursaphelenchus xylophilus]